MVTSVLWGLGVIAVAVIGGSLFVVYEARQERLADERFRSEVEELRQMYGND